MVESTLNLRSFALTALIVALFTSSMLWLSCYSPPVGYVRYEKYGFSLVYPEIMTLRESGLDVTAWPSDSKGLLQVSSYWENKLDIFEIIWIVKDKASNPDADLAALLANMSQPGNAVRSVSDSFDIILKGETVKCIDIEVEESGNLYSGIVGVVYRPWTSPELIRVIFVAYATLKGSATEQQIRVSLQAYMEGLSS